MSLDVYIYDSTMAPLASTRIEIIENDDSGVLLDSQMSRAMGGGNYGAPLTSHSCPVIVWLDDLSGTYAATDLGYLNGNLSTRLDVTLYRIPPKGSRGGGGGGGGGPRFGGGGGSYGGGGLRSRTPDTPSQIATHIQQRVDSGYWTADEATGVRMLVATTIKALQLPENADLESRLIRWIETLQELGITIIHKGRGGTEGYGGHTSGTPIDSPVMTTM